MGEGEIHVVTSKHRITTATAAVEQSWSTARIVQQIMAGNQAAVAEFYERSIRQLRCFFRARNVGAMEAEDLAHDAFLLAVRQVAAGALREPASLYAYLSTIAKRLLAAHMRQAGPIRGLISAEEAGQLRDERTEPESELLEQERWELARQVLESMKPREREILKRFYLYGQDQETICREMGLTATQYRLLKSRAKARFGLVGHKRLQRRAPNMLRGARAA